RLPDGAPDVGVGEGGQAVLQRLELVAIHLGQDVLAHAEHLEEFDERRAERSDGLRQAARAVALLPGRQHARFAPQNVPPPIAKEADDVGQQREGDAYGASEDKHGYSDEPTPFKVGSRLISNWNVAGLVMN